MPFMSWRDKALYIRNAQKACFGTLFLLLSEEVFSKLNVPACYERHVLTKQVAVPC